MRTIAIVLGDNDYGNTFKPLLESLARAIKYNGEMSEAAVRTSILAGIEFHYLAFQHGSNHGAPGYAPTASTVEYLSKARILFDDEAEADICRLGGHDGGAWYLEVFSEHISAY